MEIRRQNVKRPNSLKLPDFLLKFNTAENKEAEPSKKLTKKQIEKKKKRLSAISKAVWMSIASMGRTPPPQKKKDESCPPSPN